MRVQYDPVFLKQLKKVNVRIHKSFKQRIELFIKNPNDSQLKNHPLLKEWKGYRSININSDWRAVYEEVQDGEETFAYFVTLGTHSQLYK